MPPNAVETASERNWYYAGDKTNSTFPALMETRDSFNFKMLTTPVPSLEMLVPSPGSNLRKSSKLAATFNLIATIVGGGVLSTPLAFAKAGLALGSFLMLFGAGITDFSLYLLCACARKTGATSYGAVARHAFGPGLEVLTTFSILAYLLLVLCGFMVLIKGIWAPILLSLLHIGERDQSEDVVLLFAIIATLPLFLSRDLHGLRHSCYASFASIIVLCIAMMYRGYQKNTQDPNLFASHVIYVTTDATDALFAYPIIALAFVSSFNVVEVHCSLVNPTRRRIREVITSATFWSMLLMFLFSVAGYLNGYSNTNGNILLNFDPKDEVIFLGRIGCGICTLLAMPMSLLPCRNALLAFPVQFLEWMAHKPVPSALSASERDALLPPLDEENVLQQSEVNAKSYRSLATATEVDLSYSSSEDSSSVIEEEVCAKHEKVLRYCTTFGILSVCYAGAVLAPGVAIVWSIVGSSLAFLVQYILPAVCFIKLTSTQNGRNRRDVFNAWLLLIVSCMGAIACTTQTIWRILYMDKR